MIQKTLIASTLTLVMLSGCSDTNPADSATDAGNGGSTGNNTGTDNGNNSSGSGNNGGADPDLQTSERKLEPLNDNEAFYAALREGLIQQNRNNGIELENQQISEPTSLNEDSAVDSGAGTGSDGAGDTAGTTVGATADSTGQSTDGGTTSSAESSDVTQTNVQEIGVDEQDRMKSDGEFLYILQNQYNDSYPEGGPVPLPVIDPVNGDGPAEPVEQNEPDTEFVIELLPVSADDEIPVDSGMPPEWPQHTTQIRILALNNDVPDATPVTDLNLDLNGAWADGMYLFKEADQRNLVLTSTSFNDYLYYWDEPYAFNNASSLVSKLDVTNPTQSTVGQSLKIDGQIISSRRIDNRLFVASRFYPTVPNVDPYSMSPEEYKAAIEAADLTQSLPKITRNDGTTADLVNPGECFVAARGPSEDYYYTPDIISLSVIDLSTMQLKDSECFLGASEALYATPKSVYLATTRWDYSNSDDVSVTSNNDVDQAIEFYDPRIDTDIHQFSINGAELHYSGSGVVSGHLGWNSTRKPFRMSERGDYLRVATYSDTQDESVSPIKFSVLNVAGDGELTKVAELPNENNPKHIGKPGEQLYASRFLGDRAYLVTFRQTDPLYVIDASNPEDPKLAGELEIDGYSDYLQPIGADFLLGIGRDAVPGPVEWGEGALTQGVKLSLFNVSDANNPTEVQSIVVGERGTEAAALQNHRAITIQAATDSHPTRVAFGIDVHGLANPRPVTDDPTIWFPWNFSGLHGFDINIGSGAGIEPRGTMIVNSASNPRISSYEYYGDDRSVLVGDAVYYIRGAEVFAATWSDLGNFVGPR